MIHLSLAFLHLRVQEILLDLIVALWARNVMQFLVLPSLQLLDEEGEWDVLLGSSFLRIQGIKQKEVQSAHLQMPFSECFG